jgi:D-tyrosyl-tRNA(Tyr) deacylase
MIGLLQRVHRASVEVDGASVAAIGPGLLVLVGVELADGEAQGRRLLERLLGYRVFADTQGRMNLSLRDRAAQGQPAGLLLVPQFTLAADTAKGSRPSFTSAAEPARARELYEALVAQARREWAETGSGVFGADMQVSLVNDGPVTFWLEAGA